MVGAQRSCGFSHLGLGGGSGGKPKRVESGRHLLGPETVIAPMVVSVVLKVFGKGEKVPMRPPARIAIVVRIVSLEQGKASRDDMSHDVVMVLFDGIAKEAVKGGSQVDPEAKWLGLGLYSELPFVQSCVFME